jgi:hypothetical protein
MNFLAAIGQQEQERCAATCQIMEEFQTGIVTPVQILYHEEERRGVGLTSKDMSQTRKEAALLLLRIQRGEQQVL